MIDQCNNCGTQRLSWYQEAIIEATSCSPTDALEIEDLMRNIIFHSTLDWQSREVFDQGAREGLELLVELRKEDPNYVAL